MKFRNGKNTEWVIFRLMGGNWESWDSGFKNQAAAERELKKDYHDADHYAVVRVDTTMVTRGSDTKRYWS